MAQDRDPSSGSRSAVLLAGDYFGFTQTTYTGAIYENTLGKVYIQTPRKMGIHLRYPSSLDVEYSIVDGDPNNIFKAETTTVKDFCFLRIRTQTVNYGMLNRELNSIFNLRIKARGLTAGTAALTNFTNVIVTVLDQNEFSPMFSSVPYEVSIPEDTPLYESIGQVKASDADEGINGEIYYSFVQATLVFSIHPTTGVVSLSRPVRYDERQVYELDVVAEDRGEPSHSRGISPNSKTQFKVNILPVNFNPPSITYHNHQSLVEHGNLGTVFAVLTVIDDDRSSNGEIGRVAIINDYNKHFQLVPEATTGKYNIVVKSAIDREALPDNYNITVIAVDKGSPLKTATVVIPVRVQDINDNEPEFEQSVYLAELSEIVPVNTPVLFVKARDKDVGLNAEVAYSIIDGNKKELFVIDPKSGLITTSGHLDAEADSRLTLVVQAQDQPSSGSRKTGQARVIISLKDYNDNSPAFNIPEDFINVRENLPRGSRVVTVLANDEDPGDNGKLSFSLVNYDSVPFEIDAFTGEVTTKEVLDYETMQRRYWLYLRVSDRGLPFKREEDMIMTVRLEDVNDNSPEFETNRCFGYLSREAPLKIDIVTLFAVDFDSGNIVTYSITEGNDDDCFNIAPTSGLITVNCDMSRFQDVTRSLTVVASDGQHVSVPASVDLKLVDRWDSSLESEDVKISCQKTDVVSRFQQQIHKSEAANAGGEDPEPTRPSKLTNNPPTISKTFPSIVEVSESADVGTVVLNFEEHVVDENSGFNGQLVYVISASDDPFGAFILDTFTGELQVFSRLDYEVKSEYSLTLTAIDLGDPSLQVSKNIKVTVVDENDNVPIFEKSVYMRKISESAAVDSSVLHVKATDLDSGINSEITYSIVSDSRDFHIDPHLGLIKVKRALDRETRPVQTLLIQAEDSGLRTKLASTTTVNITLTDVNDNSPLFVPEQHLVRVREDLPLGAIITTLTAHDLDEGDNGKVTYSFIHGIDQHFEIDSLTGSIRVKRALDYETRQVYNFTAVAVDGGKPELTSTCLISIEVMDVNENYHAPVFSDFMALGKVAENVPVGTFVMNVQARRHDGTSPGPGQMFYHILEGSGLGRFAIDENGEYLHIALLCPIILC